MTQTKVLEVIERDSDFAGNKAVMDLVAAAKAFVASSKSTEYKANYPSGSGDNQPTVLILLVHIPPPP